jgi:hypothetical protein
MAVRVADAMRRGALVTGSIDFMGIDFFAIADQPVEELRRHFGIVAKSERAIAAGSVGPWQPGGISEYQWNTGERLAESTHTAYDSFGATVTPDVSSTGVRQRIASGQSLSGLVPVSVERHILQHGLYVKASGVSTANHLHGEN